MGGLSTCAATLHALKAEAQRLRAHLSQMLAQTQDYVTQAWSVVQGADGIGALAAEAALGWPGKGKGLAPSKVMPKQQKLGAKGGTQGAQHSPALPSFAAHGRAAVLNMAQGLAMADMAIMNRALPGAWTAALLCSALLTYGAVMGFFFTAVRAFGGSLAWGIALAAPVSSLVSYLRARAATHGHEAAVASMLPSAVNHAVQTHKDEVSCAVQVDSTMLQSNAGKKRGTHALSLHSISA